MVIKSFNFSSGAISQNVILTSCSLLLGVTIGYFSTRGKKLVSSLGTIPYLSNAKTNNTNSDLVDQNFNLTEANFTYTFQKISEIRRSKRDIFSPTIWIGDLPWKIMLRPTRLCLDCHVICSELYCSWSCCVHLEFSLLGKVPRVLAKDHELYEADSQSEYNRNMGQDIPWEELLDPGNEYIDNESLTFHVNLKVEVLERISWSDKMYLSDPRANSLVKKYKTDTDILRKRIEQLSGRNQQLEKEMKLVQMYKNTNFL